LLLVAVSARKLYLFVRALPASKRTWRHIACSPTDSFKTFVSLHMCIQGSLGSMLGVLKLTTDSCVALDAAPTFFLQMLTFWYCNIFVFVMKQW
jgi:hypothetical protein